MEVDNPTSSFSAPLPQLAQSPTKTRERLIPKGGKGAGLEGVGKGVGGDCAQQFLCGWLARTFRDRAGVEGSGLHCSRAPAGDCLPLHSQPALRGRPGAAPEGRAKGKCEHWSLESGWWRGCAAAGWWGSGSTVRPR